MNLLARLANWLAPQPRPRPDDVLMRAVAEALIRHSDVFVSWTFEYPGFIAVHNDAGGSWSIGTANGTWGADLYLCDDAFVQGEGPDHSIDTGIPADVDDPARIAAALFAAMVEVPRARR